MKKLLFFILLGCSSLMATGQKNVGMQSEWVIQRDIQYQLEHRAWAPCLSSLLELEKVAPHLFEQRNWKTLRLICDAKNNPTKIAQLENYLQEGNSTYQDLGWWMVGTASFQKKDYSKALNQLQSIQNKDQFQADELIQINYMTGVCQFQKGNYKTAKNLFNDIKDLSSPYKGQVNYLLAYILISEKDYQKAIEQYKKIDSDPSYSKEVIVKVAELLYELKQYQELISYAQNKVGNITGSEEVSLFRLLGLAYYHTKDYYKCQSFLKKTSQSEKLGATENYFLGLSSFLIKDYKEALDPLGKVGVQKDSLGQNATYYLAHSLLENGNKDQARLAFQAASKMNFDLAIKEECSFHNAQLSYELGQLVGALPALQNFIKDYPKSNYNTKARELLSTMLLEANDFKSALEILEKIPEFDFITKKTYQRAAYYRGVELYNAGDFKEAINCFYKSQQHLVDKKIEILSHFWRAEALFKQGDFAGCNFSHQKFLNQFEESFKLPVESSPMVAHYTLGYSYYKTGKNAQAQSEFSKSAQEFEQNRIGALKVLGQGFAADLYGRLGDLHFLTGNYASAKNAYGEISKNQWPSAEYAELQMAILTGLEGKTTDKLEQLKTLLVKYPNSAYKDQVLLEIASMYFTQVKFDDALAVLQQLISERKESAYLKKAYLTKGLIEYNLEKYEDAIVTLKQVVENFPRTNEAEDAMETLENIYSTLNRVDDYLKYASVHSNIQPSEAKQDSLTFLAAENQFRKKNVCKEAVDDYTNYLKKFPQGLFVDKAHFLRAECYNRMNFRTQALEDYEYIIAQKRNSYSEAAYINAARLAFQLKNYTKALQFFQELQKFALAEGNLLDAKAGETQCLFALGNYGDCKKAADRLLNSRSVPIEMQALANLYLGKAEIENNNLGAAFTALDKVLNLVKDEKAAEARYLQAMIYFKQGKQEKCQNAIFDLTEKLPFFGTWISKGFMLLADSYVAQKNIFQAIATLEGLIENEDQTDLLEEAKKKLEVYKKMEGGQ
jgi:tetratricopeptide (TPR) repeat protein